MRFRAIPAAVPLRSRARSSSGQAASSDEFWPKSKRHPQAAPSARQRRVSERPRLPAHVTRYRNQKTCPYCKHSIGDDPYFQDRGFWSSYFAHKLFASFTAILTQVRPRSRISELGIVKNRTLPGWVRCKNGKCGQLYHANCWYHVKTHRGCLRCGSKKARRLKF